MDNKKLLMIGGIVVVAFGMYYFLRKPKDEKLSYDTEGDTPSEPPVEEPQFSRRITVSNALGAGEYNWFSVKNADRSKADAQLLIGTKGMVNGTQPCTINDFWIDANDKKAAFRCEEMNLGDYDIPAGSRFDYN